MSGKIKLAIAGLGNCASSLIQGLYYYKNALDEDTIPGLMHVNFGGYRPADIEVVAAFDVDERKVGKDLSEAIFAETNMAYNYGVTVPKTGVIVQMGPVLDGVPEHLASFHIPVKVADQEPCDIAQVLKDSEIEDPDLVDMLRTFGKRTVSAPDLELVAAE